ncbi:GAF domain-containing protein [Mesorhizobium albiziae]|uniref:histidine kinase n=1 Tax=Neomesorhizobium albiziae TaxID=335020 RepID=A0A1I4CT96_9HYPH|nr:GAF domain-containing sensor histidine kinase [Mesorhizobium albiziae]GLS30954.1 sensor histidine kinase [Mesorhizobium albiziae]SFK83246.1 GAF domain-containing protein [Mesorhizobium albiziae]
MPHDFQDDIDAIQSISAVPTILDVVCQTTGMRFAAVARVTEGRWVTCTVLDNIDFGLKPGDELKVETTICHEIRQSREPVVINHVAKDGVFCGHPTPAMYGFQSYISMPIILRSGEFFGTLCAIDPAPAQLKNSKIIGMFKLFAELIAAHLDANSDVSKARSDLRDEREISELREQFIAVLGHDLRNPLASIDAGTKMLQRVPLDEKSRSVVALMQGSVLRMRGLIDNVLDFARARLGDGLNVEFDAESPLEPVLEQVVSELRSADIGREIQTDFRLTARVAVDHQRISQMVSNLLGNALTYGAENTPVHVRATTENGEFVLWVENTGEPIPDEAMRRLFQPFFRGKVRASHQGLGLGLFIAQEIARVHKGTLEAKSDEKRTRFTFRMPLDVS